VNRIGVIFRKENILVSKDKTINGRGRNNDNFIRRGFKNDQMFSDKSFLL
jgi:hypothetical protein